MTALFVMIQLPETRRQKRRALMPLFLIQVDFRHKTISLRQCYTFLVAAESHDDAVNRYRAKHPVPLDESGEPTASVRLQLTQQEDDMVDFDEILGEHVAFAEPVLGASQVARALGRFCPVCNQTRMQRLERKKTERLAGRKKAASKR
jgi:hypothetical protein